MAKFVAKYNLSRLTPIQTENIKVILFIKEIDNQSMNPPEKSIRLTYLYNLKDKMIPVLLKQLQSSEKEKNFQILYMSQV